MSRRSEAGAMQVSDALLQAVLAAAVRDGWAGVRLEAAALLAGEDADRVRIAFPGGAPAVFEAWMRALLAGVEEELRAEDLTGLKIRERVRTGAGRVFERLEPRRAQLPRAFAGLATAPLLPALSWIAADAVWSGVRDRSVDMNWYTKRATLAAVIASTWLVFLDPAADWRAFLDRRIADVMAFEAFKRQFARRAAGGNPVSPPPA